MNPKYQKVLSDIEKAEKKKSEIEGQLKELYDKKTELPVRSFQSSAASFRFSPMFQSLRTLSA